MEIEMNEIRKLIDDELEAVNGGGLGAAVLGAALNTLLVITPGTTFIGYGILGAVVAS